MKNFIVKLFDNFWFKVISLLLLTILPAYPFYKNLFIKVAGFFSQIETNSLDFTKNLFYILTGFLLAGMYLLYLNSRNEYNRIRAENKRIREMLLTIHLFDNQRFGKLKTLEPNLFLDEEQYLKRHIKEVFKHDLGKDYNEVEISEILDCFYKRKPKFI